MASSASTRKRKLEEEGRRFQNSWERDYFFTEVGNAAMCLICRKNIAVFKQYNIKSHYNSLHRTAFEGITGKDREEKLKKLKTSFANQKGLFVSVRKTASLSVQASFAISEFIA